MKKNLLPIEAIAAKLGLPAESAQDSASPLYEKRSPVSAKLSLALLDDPRFNAQGKLILVTATTPTVFGEGKTVTSIGLVQGLERIGKRAILSSREPSLVYSPGESWCKLLPRVGTCMMAKALHGSARTTPRLRADLQRSKESTRSLAAKYGLNPKTVAKWRKRTDTADAPMGPRQRRTVALSAAEEAMVVELRRRTLLPLDDVLGSLRDNLPKLEPQRLAPLPGAPRHLALACR